MATVTTKEIGWCVILNFRSFYSRQSGPRVDRDQTNRHDIQTVRFKKTLIILLLILYQQTYMRIQGVGGGGVGFLSNTGPDPLKDHNATKPAFNVGPSSARQ